MEGRVWYGLVWEKPDGIMSPINNQNSTVYQGFPERGSGLVRMKDGDSDDHEGRNGEFVLAWVRLLFYLLIP